MVWHVYIIVICMSHQHPRNPKFGWRPDKADSRDKILRLGSGPLTDVPIRVDLREYCSTVENQYQVGSCTANSVVGALEYLEKKDGMAVAEDLSRLFIYYNTRVIENTVELDNGATIRNAIKALADVGTCREDMWPYVPDQFATKPNQACYDYAKVHTIADYSRIATFQDMIRCLAAGYPFAFGFQVYSEFEGPLVAQTGVLNLPNPTEYCCGGHAVLAVGYDMDKCIVIVRNSWGSGWGQDGYFTMPFAYISNPNLAADMWCIKKYLDADDHSVVVSS